MVCGSEGLGVWGSGALRLWGSLVREKERKHREKEGKKRGKEIKI